MFFFAIYEVEGGRNLESIKGGLSLWKSLDAEVAHAELCLVDKIIISSWQDFHLEGGFENDQDCIQYTSWECYHLVGGVVDVDEMSKNVKEV